MSAWVVSWETSIEYLSGGMYRTPPIFFYMCPAFLVEMGTDVIVMQSPFSMLFRYHEIAGLYIQVYTNVMYKHLLAIFKLYAVKNSSLRTLSRKDLLYVHTA